MLLTPPINEETGSIVLDQKQEAKDLMIFVADGQSDIASISSDDPPPLINEKLLNMASLHL